MTSMYKYTDNLVTIIISVFLIGRVESDLKIIRAL